MTNKDKTERELIDLLISVDNNKRKCMKARDGLANSIDFCIENEDELNSLFDIGILVKQVNVDSDKKVNIKAIANNRYKNSIFSHNKPGVFDRLINNIGMKVLE